MKNKVYIAGKITGDPHYKEKFEAAAESLRGCGYIVLNPAVNTEGLTPADYMRICFAMIDSCDFVYFLADFQDSPGALLERQYCRYIGKEHQYQVPPWKK